MEKKENLIITAVGPDKIGLVERMSDFVEQHECNIEDSKMAVFCGEFTIILLISGQAGNLEKVAEIYRELEALTGLSISIRRPTKRVSTTPSLPYKVTASCLDHPGVVHKISSVLSNLAVNIESMETQTHCAPVSGTPIFCMEALVSVPVALNLNALKTRFNEIERAENIDITLLPLTK